MKAQEIKIKHIYYVDFEPSKKGEFGKKHLAVVLKKNHDKITFIALPLTSKSKGLGKNKISLGKLDCLPSNLKENETFAVYDQIRTVSAKRFYKLMDDKKEFDAVLTDDQFSLLLETIFKDLMFNLDTEEKKNICNNLYKEYSCKSE